MIINLIYATKVNLGGWATFTVHLYNLLELAGHTPRLIKIGNRTENNMRPFAGHGLQYRNVAEEDLPALMESADHTIIAALGKHFVTVAEAMLASGAGIVVHDTAESTNRMAVKRPWVIRKALKPLFDDAVFIRHPYVRATGAQAKRRTGFIATSRVDFDKNTKMILDANRMGAGIDIVGFENRLYTRFKICPDYPEWVQSTGDHPRSGVGSFNLLRSAKGMVDLTDIKGDGGGTQYTFLEAWDAGAVPIIGAWWIQKGDDMKDGENCLTVENATELYKTCKRWPKDLAEQCAAAGQKRLALHGKKIVPQIIKWLESL